MLVTGSGTASEFGVSACSVLEALWSDALSDSKDALGSRVDVGLSDELLEVLSG